MYHSVGSGLKGPAEGWWSIDPLLFREQMVWLAAASGFEAVPLAAPRAGTAPSVAVTFDDGYRDNLAEAAPILSELAIPFTVFVVPRFIESGEPLYLDRSDLRRLAGTPGCTLGSHGWSHRPLASLSPSEALAELRDSRAWLEDVLARPIRSLAYPFGSVDPRVRDLAAEAGYDLAVTTRTGLNGPDRDPLLLNRTEIVGQDDPAMFRLKLRGGWDWHRLRRKVPLGLP